MPFSGVMVVHFRLVWADAISLFYAFPVATLAFYGISYQSLSTAYELEAEFTRWRAAKYKYKEA